MTLQLKAEKRDIFGKKLMSARKEGKLPAVVYSKGEKSSPVFVALKDFKKTWKEAGESTVIELDENGKKKDDVLIKEVAIDPVSEEPIHADFYKIEKDKPIKAEIDIIFEGVSAAVKEIGGILVKVMHGVEIEALPRNLPHELKVDISKLKTFEDKITVSDICLPDGVKILAKENDIVALVEEPKAEEVVVERTIEDIEVEKKGKKEEDKEEGEEEKK